MTLFQLPTSLARTPWAQPFQQLVSIARCELLLVSPFIKSESTDQILSNLQRRAVDKEILVAVLTNLRPESVLSGSGDVEALSTLGKALPRFDLIHLPSLHAKVYVADDKAGVVTSANLTRPGITGNLE
jgi:phosphatidylserine/phosphatidylglycerophosphate/cardiolipin synthase-like enzyme